MAAKWILGLAWSDSVYCCSCVVVHCWRVFPPSGFSHYRFRVGGDVICSYFPGHSDLLKLYRCYIFRTLLKALLRLLHSPCIWVLAMAFLVFRRSRFSPFGWWGGPFAVFFFFLVGRFGVIPLMVPLFPCVCILAFVRGGFLVVFVAFRSVFQMWLVPAVGWFAFPFRSIGTLAVDAWC